MIPKVLKRIPCSRNLGYVRKEYHNPDTRFELLSFCSSSHEGAGKLYMPWRQKNHLWDEQKTSVIFKVSDFNNCRTMNESWMVLQKINRRVLMTTACWMRESEVVGRKVQDCCKHLLDNVWCCCILQDVGKTSEDSVEKWISSAL